jgi:hypothetical protein
MAVIFPKLLTNTGYNRPPLALRVRHARLSSRTGRSLLVPTLSWAGLGLGGVALAGSFLALSGPAPRAPLTVVAFARSATETDAVDPQALHLKRVEWVKAQVIAWRQAHPTYHPKFRADASHRTQWANAIRPGATDQECLTQAIYYEARGEPAAGQAAVAQVVLNRSRDPHYPKTVCGVVFQGASRPGCQFSFACEGDVQASRRRNEQAWARAEGSAVAALSGAANVDASVTSATHYHTDAVKPRWDANLARLAQIGRHIFFGASDKSTRDPPAVRPPVSGPSSWTELIWGHRSA